MGEKPRYQGKGGQYSVNRSGTEIGFITGRGGVIENPQCPGTFCPSPSLLSGHRQIAAARAPGDLQEHGPIHWIGHVDLEELGCP